MPRVMLLVAEGWEIFADCDTLHLKCQNKNVPLKCCIFKNTPPSSMRDHCILTYTGCPLKNYLHIYWFYILTF